MEGPEYNPLDDEPIDREEYEAWEQGQILLPCPFCAGEATFDHLTGIDDFFVSCTKCEVQQIANYERGVAIKRWNTRAKSRGG